MRRQKGVVLVLVISFMLIYTLLGLAIMEFNGFQGQWAARKVGIAQAFWLAESGVQSAIDSLQKDTHMTTMIIPNTVLGQGFYHATISNCDPVHPADCYNATWWIDSTGTIPYATKKIRAMYGPHPMEAVNHKDEIDMRGSVEINGSTSQWDFSFEQVFKKNTTDMMASCTVYHPVQNSVSPANGRAWIDLSSGLSGNSLSITSAGWTGGGLMIIDAASQPGLNIHIEGGTFSGIIWVIGDNIQITGNGAYSGAVFLDNEGSNKVTVLGGTANFAFDQHAIDQVFAYNNISAFSVVDWQEDPLN